MRKFAYQIQAGGKVLYVKAKTLTEARVTLSTTFGRVHTVYEVRNHRLTKSVSLFDYELSLLN